MKSLLSSASQLQMTAHPMATKIMARLSLSKEQQRVTMIVDAVGNKDSSQAIMVTLSIESSLLSFNNWSVGYNDVAPSLPTVIQSCPAAFCVEQVP
jgi:hypothetical protein